MQIQSKACFTRDGKEMKSYKILHGHRSYKDKHITCRQLQMDNVESTAQKLFSVTIKFTQNTTASSITTLCTRIYTCTWINKIQASPMYICISSYYVPLLNCLSINIFSTYIYNNIYSDY